jgi:hypothetical protein
VKYVRSFARFWWNFVVGDDWRLAAGLAVAITLTWLLTHEDVNAWLLLPIASLSCSPTRSAAKSAEGNAAPGA